MSAVTSSPNARDNKGLNPTAFSNPSFDDPFLPATSNPEDLLQASEIGLRPTAAGTQPSYQGSYHSSAHNSHVNSQRNSHSPSGSFSHHQPTSNPNSSQYDPNQYTNHTLSTSPPTQQDFLSPYDYSSEFLSSEYSEHTTPTFEDEFFLATGYSSLPEGGNGIDHNYSNPAQGDFYNVEPVIHDQLPPSISKNTNPPPAATFATSQPQLLSPVLTNTPSPSSEYRNLQVGAAPIGGSQSTSQFNDMVGRRTRADIPPRALQQTPTLTGSSSSSLEPGPMEPIARAASPIVRVSSYSRGDSPARSHGIGRSSSKRSRTSHSPGHLSPARDEDLSEDEPEEVVSSQNFRPMTVSSEGLRADDGSWIPDIVSGQAGLDPGARAQMSDVYVPSIKQIEEERQMKEKNETIADWMDKSDAGSVADDDPNAPDLQRKAEGTKLRRRAKSMVEPIRTSNIGLGIEEPVFDDSGIPGPGVLIDEKSDDDYSESESSQPASPPAEVNTTTADEDVGYFPAGAEEEPLPRQFYRAKVWHDRQDTDITFTKMQPDTSNAAMMRFKQRAENIETASRSATWGTRRMSETDINKVIGSDGLFKSLSLNRGGKDKPDRRPSLLKHAEQAAAKLLPKRSNSNMKRKLAEAAQQNSSSDSLGKAKRDSLGSLVPPKRSSSFGRSPKSPPLNTGSAVAAMATSIAAVGGGTPMSATSPVPPTSWSKGVIRRSRSRSELPRSKPSASPGLAELMTHHGGPPMPTLASPHQEKPVQPVRPMPRSVPQKQEDDDDDEDEDDITEDKGVAMDLKVRTDAINPNLEGFKTHVRQLNPRLQPFLIDRIGTEQLRRYKKLVEFKVKHVHTISIARCPSGAHCFAQGGEATILPPRTSAKDPETTYAGFQVTGTGSDDESGAFAEGAVTAALFPPGVPLPPVKRLPAEFECSLCYKVKKFQKPSDWTKHVHEDVQPFTCTFPTCAEPKSFKRKADWVRHENERHRQLEWWTCNMPDCSHTCYRKDNFVQHLVREHKKPEPKVKAAKPARGTTGKEKGRGSKTQAEVIEEWKANLPDPAQDEVDKVWRLVDECRHDTKKLPKDEACKFCGNVCNSWKKLTVHLAKHMEQIAMPVLELVKQREVDPDTIISPVEKLPASRLISGSPDTPVTKTEPMSVSPYSVASSHIPQHHRVEPDSLGNYSQGTGDYYPTSLPMSDYSSQFQSPVPQIHHQMQQTTMAGYGPNVQAGYDVTSYPTYNVSPSQQQPPRLGQTSFMPINLNVNNTPATYPPAFLPSRSSQRIPGAAGQVFVPEHLQQSGQGQGPEVYGSPIDGMTYVYPATSMPGMGYDVPYSQAGDSQGNYQNQGGSQGGYGYHPQQ